MANLYQEGARNKKSIIKNSRQKNKPLNFLKGLLKGLFIIKISQ